MKGGGARGRNADGRKSFAHCAIHHLSASKALVQARVILDPVERKCAQGIIQACRAFLTRQAPAHVGIFPTMGYSLPNGLNLSISPIWLRHLDPKLLMVLHFWQKPLSAWQLGAAGAVLRSALTQQQPAFANYEIDFVSVPLPEFARERRLEH
jgi:hypothetical protein